MKHSKRLLAGLVCWIGLVGCTESISTPDSVGSETNWLINCDADAECGNSSCLCGVCTTDCDGPTGCAGFESAVCSVNGEAAYAAQCSEMEASPGICLPECSTNNDCATAQRCEDGACVFIATDSNPGTPDGDGLPGTPDGGGLPGTPDGDGLPGTPDDGGLPGTPDDGGLPGTPDGDGLLLSDREFLLDSAQGYTVVDNTSIRISFRRDDVGGLGFSLSAGCNSIFGSFALRDGVMDVDSDSVGMTAMGCAPELHSQDGWLVDFLKAGPRLELDGDRLTLTGSNATLSFLDREVVDPDRALAGPTWTIDTLIDGGGASSVTLEPTVVFSDDGTIQINSTCNSGGGNYTTDGSNITFSGLFYTEMACLGTDASRVEAHIQAVFAEGTATYEIDASRLTIQHGSKGVRARTE